MNPVILALAAFGAAVLSGLVGGFLAALALDHMQVSTDEGLGVLLYAGLVAFVCALVAFVVVMQVGA
jgi:hypothetical protein